MLNNALARLLLRIRYRSRSLAATTGQFHAAVASIEDLVSSTAEPILRGRRPVPPLPGVTPVMRGWSAFMTIDHINGVHEAMIGLIAELEAGRGTFQHPIFGRLDSRGAYALLAFHLQLHVPQIRRSVEINGPPRVRRARGLRGRWRA